MPEKEHQHVRHFSNLSIFIFGYARKIKVFKMNYDVASVYTVVMTKHQLILCDACARNTNRRTI